MVVIVVVGLSCGLVMWTSFIHAFFKQKERERERERERRTLRADTPPRHYLLPATPRSCFRSSHTFIPPSTQCLDHGGIFPHLMTSVVIHSSWTAPPFHGLRRGQRSSLFQTRPFTNFACRFGGQHLPGFPSLPFRRPETQRTPKTTTNSWFQELSVFLHSSHCRRGQGLLFFLCRKTTYSSRLFLQRSIIFLLFCPRSLQTSVRLFGSWTKPTKSSIVLLPQVFRSHRSPGFPQILCTRIITRIPMPSLVIVHRFEARRNHSHLSARFCNNYCKTSFDSEISTGSCRVFVPEAHLDPHRDHQAGLSSFSNRYFCQSSDKSFHNWSSKLDKSSSYCCSLAIIKVRTQAPCSIFISFTEKHPATKDSMLSICGLSPGLCRLLLFLFVLRPEPLCPG